METTTVHYRGFQINVTARKDHDDLWDFDYEISKDATVISSPKLNTTPQARSMGQYETPAAACDTGIEIAKIEIDNRIALTEK